MHHVKLDKAALTVEEQRIVRGCIFDQPGHRVEHLVARGSLPAATMVIVNKK